MGNFWSNGDGNKTLSIEEYLNQIRPYLKDIINDLQKVDTWKIKSTIAINFMSSKDNDKDREMHSKSDNIEIMINDEAGEVIEESFQLPLSGHQIGLETLMKGSDFAFVYVQLLYYKCYEINPSCDGSYIDSLYWIKNKKATINLIDINYDKYFQYAATVTLDYGKIGKNSQRITKNKPFIDKHNWERINYLSLVSLET